MLSTSAASGGQPVAISKTGDIVFLNDDILKKKNEVKVADLMPLPNATGARQVLFIAAPSGSGKSVMSKNYIKSYQAMWPKSDVYIFSKIQDDPSLEGIKNPYFIPIDDSLITAPVDILNDVEDQSLILFDDIDTVSDKHIAQALTNIMLDCLELGRHKKITVIITSHLICPNDRKRGRTILNEATRIILFPRCSSAHSIMYFLKVYVGITDKGLIKKILDAPSRWVCINRNFPQYVITAHSAFMI